MNAGSHPEGQVVSLVDIIHFKWLMSHEGHSVHVERLQQDPAYAALCFAKAEASASAALRQVAGNLRGKFLQAP